jgi:quercetin dioxygenase-like cupin family protein
MTNGRFLLAKDVPLAQVDWGQVGLVNNPSETGAAQLLMARGRFGPGKGHAFHMHPFQEELIVIVSGQIEQWIEREKRMLGPGDAVFLAPGTVHASFNVGEVEAELLAIFGPVHGDRGFETVELADHPSWRDMRRSVADRKAGF